VVVAGCAAVALAVVACAAAAVDSVAGASLPEASGAAVFGAVDFEAALTAVLDSVGDPDLFPSTDFTAAMDTPIRSSTIPIHLLILIPMDTRMPGTLPTPPA